MDALTVLLVIVAIAVVVVLGPLALFRSWSWGDRIDALRARRARSRQRGSRRR